MNKCYTVNGVGFYIQEQPQHKALEQAIEYAHRVDSKVLDVDGEQVWPVECEHDVCGCNVVGHTLAEQRLFNRALWVVCIVCALIVLASYLLLDGNGLFYENKNHAH